MGFKAFGGVEHVKFCLCGTVGCKGGLVGGFGGVCGVRHIAGLLAAAAGAAALGAVGRFGAAAARGADSGKPDRRFVPKSSRKSTRKFKITTKSR